MNTDRFSGQVALVTGASSGLGRAISLEFARLGGSVYLCGRSSERLEEVAGLARTFTARATVCPCDLTREDDIQRLGDRVAREESQLDLLVHSAGSYLAATVADTSASDLDALYASNVRGPYLLTAELLPLLRRARGQIAFINSTVVFGSAPGVSAYSMMKHALMGFAEHLRTEVNGEGVRVLSIFPGRTATPMQERIRAAEGKPYNATTLLQPEDVAAAVLDAVCLPRTAEVTEIRIRPMVKS